MLIFEEAGMSKYQFCLLARPPISSMLGQLSASKTFRKDGSDKLHDWKTAQLLFSENGEEKAFKILMTRRMCDSKISRD